MSRHYYDLVMIGRSAFAEGALTKVGLLEVVAKHKALYFRSGWANYGDAKPGTLRLVPPDSRLTELKSDYTKMAPMFFGQPPAFDDLMSALDELERRINKASAG
jgi:hypothetical protein